MDNSLKTILLPTDFSSNAYNAIKFAIKTFGYKDCRFILMYAFKTPHIGASILVSVEDIMLKEASRTLEQEVEKIRIDFPSDELKIIPKAVYGDIVFGINELNTEFGVDIVVMGTRGASGFKEKLIGSNAAEVIKLIKKPVMVIPKDITFQPLNHIIFASDNQKFNNSDEWRFLNYLVDKFESHVEILYVSKKSGTNNLSGNPKKLITQFKNSEYTYLKDSENDVTTCIDKYLQKRKADLVTLTTRHYDFIENIFHKSVTRQLVMQAKYPMLILHD